MNEQMRVVTLTISRHEKFLTILFWCLNFYFIVIYKNYEPTIFSSLSDTICVITLGKLDIFIWVLWYFFLFFSKYKKIKFLLQKN